jgi:uncharacterized SAM-binding protein YcdF (DUF218 family)
MKSLIVLFQPLCLAWLLLAGWLVQACWRRRWLQAALPALAWLLLTAFTCTPLASVLVSGLENQHARVVMADLLPADAIICLGGGAEPSTMEPSGFHLKASGDRLSTALALWQGGKAPLLVLGGGGYRDNGPLLSEADRVAEALKPLAGVSGAVLSLGVCADTRDEAAKVASLAKERGWKRLLLVTSAYHMPRAFGTFQKAGVAVEAIPCNYLSSLNRVGELHWFHLPHADGLVVFNTWLHEVLGTWHYRRQGWL